MGINQWPAHERPRERLISEGAQALSNAELLALFLRTGVKGKSAVELARETVFHFGSLQGLFGASLHDFCAVHGLGAAKFAQLQAVMELARRAIGEQLTAGQTLSSPQAVKEYLRLMMSNKSHESFYVLFLDVKNRLIETKEMFRGTLTQLEDTQQRKFHMLFSCNVYRNGRLEAIPLIEWKATASYATAASTSK